MDYETDPDVFVIDPEGRLRWSFRGGPDDCQEDHWISCAGSFYEILAFEPHRPDRGQILLLGTGGYYIFRWTPGMFLETCQISLEDRFRDPREYEPEWSGVFLIRP